MDEPPNKNQMTRKLAWCPDGAVTYIWKNCCNNGAESSAPSASTSTTVELDAAISEPVPLVSPPGVDEELLHLPLSPPAVAAGDAAESCEADDHQVPSATNNSLNRQQSDPTDTIVEPSSNVLSVDGEDLLIQDCFQHEPDVAESVDRAVGMYEMGPASDLHDVDANSVGSGDAIVIGNGDLAHRVPLAFVEQVGVDVREVNGIKFAIMCPMCNSLRCAGPDGHAMSVHVCGPLMDRLPLEVTTTVLAYLTAQELVTYVTPVSKAWRMLAYTPSLWTTINLHHQSDMSSTTLNYILKRTRHRVTTIKFNGRRLSMLDAEIWSSQCINLTHLDMSFCRNVTVEVMSIVQQNCPHVKSLNLQGVKNIKMDVMQVISRWPLQTISLHYCEHTRADVLIFLVENVQRLISLDINGIQVAEEDSVVQAIAKHHFSSLELLDLDGEELTEDGFHHLSSCTRLTRLTMHYCHSLSDRVLPCILDLQSLRHLKIRDGKNLTAAGISKLFTGVELSGLEILDLSECSCINDEVVQLVVHACGRNLRELNLSWAYLITDSSCDQIIFTCKKLEKLYFVGNKLMEGKNLLNIINFLPHLKILDLEMCDQINDEMLVKLVSKKQDLVVTNYYGEQMQYAPNTR